MYVKLKQSETRMAALESKNTFLEKSDQARRLLHTELRELQMRLMETRDSHLDVQHVSAAKVLDLQQDRENFMVIQQTISKELWKERTKSKQLEAELQRARAIAAGANVKISDLLDKNMVCEDDLLQAVGHGQELSRHNEELRAQVSALAQQLQTSRNDGAAKVAELANHLDILVSAVSSHGRALVRQGGGFTKLAALLERECRAEDGRRQSLRAKNLR